MRVGAGVLLFAGVVEALKMPAVFCGSGIVRPVRAAPPPFMKDDGEQEKKKGIDLSGLMQVMSMGAGAPMLGDLKKTNFDKPESEGGAALQFELEANNFDLDQRGTYFDDGYVDTSDNGPGFFENLLSGGKMQREYDERMRKRRGGK